jgi:hypothetical protein
MLARILFDVLLLISAVAYIGGMVAIILGAVTLLHNFLEMYPI